MTWFLFTFFVAGLAGGLLSWPVSQTTNINVDASASTDVSVDCCDVFDNNPYDHLFDDAGDAGFEE